MKEALSSSETLVLRRAARRNIPEDAILQNFSLFIFQSWLLDIRINYEKIKGDNL
jgi:hypothetical protein